MIALKLTTAGLLAGLAALPGCERPGAETVYPSHVTRPHVPPGTVLRSVGLALAFAALATGALLLFRRRIRRSTPRPTPGDPS